MSQAEYVGTICAGFDCIERRGCKDSEAVQTRLDSPSRLLSLARV